MLNNHRTMSRFLSSQTLTVAIVSSVVLINSVAWGIPLLVKAGEADPVQDISSTNTIAAPTLPTPLVKRAEGKVVKSAFRGSSAPVIPLPAKAPEFEQERLHSREPATLFPRPQAAPELLQVTTAAAAPVRLGAPQRSRQRARHSARDIVLVSPYTPGVRVAPDGRAREWRHRNLRSSSGTTTFDKARAIARRAAQRFEQMRDRMAKLDARDAATNEERARGLALLPVAPRPPRIVTGSVGRSATKSAHNYVRARLIRRPIGDAIVWPPRNFSPAFVMSVAPAEAIVVPADSPSAQPTQRLARLTATAVARSPRRRSRSVRSRRSAARARSKWLRAKRSRASRAVRTARRRSKRYRRYPRKINGFRRSFHRQLVAANFYGTAN
ncbi:MAG: hypothetical protein JXQ99_16975 [Hyphomicrobiaceae bacterium]